MNMYDWMHKGRYACAVRGRLPATGLASMSQGLARLRKKTRMGSHTKEGLVLTDHGETQRSKQWGGGLEEKFIAQVALSSFLASTPHPTTTHPATHSPTNRLAPRLCHAPLRCRRRQASARRGGQALPRGRPFHRRNGHGIIA